MFLRFTTTSVDKGSRKPEGIFAAGYRLLDSGELDSAEWKQLRELMDWFNAQLPKPPESFEAARAVFWFRSTAAECISRIWEMVFILREHGHHVLVHKCDHLANVCYRDRVQVAAYPSVRDGRTTVQ